VASGDRDPRPDPAALAAGYERLRAAVSCGAPDGFRSGHAVLRARGMAAWIETAAALAPVTRDPGAPGPVAGAPVPAPPCDAKPRALPEAGEIVAVLGEMALAHAA